MIVPPGAGLAALAVFFYALSLGPARPHQLMCLPNDPVQQMKKAFNELPFVAGDTGEGRVTVYMSKTGSTFTVIFKPADQKMWCALINGVNLKPEIAGKDS